MVALTSHHSRANDVPFSRYGLSQGAPLRGETMQVVGVRPIDVIFVSVRTMGWRVGSLSTSGPSHSRVDRARASGAIARH